MKEFYCHILTRNQKKDNFKDFTVALYITFYTILPMNITDKITYQGHFHCRHFAI